jgi:uncharacterized membrane protein
MVMKDAVVARALHMVAVVIWIGGLAMVTTVLLPAIRKGDFGAGRLAAFRAVEHRFVWQARAAIIIVGLSGLYMIGRQDMWDRFRSAQFWWMHAMVGLWVLFVFVLFVAEPLIAHRFFDRWAAAAPQTAFAWLHRMHVVLLVLSLTVIFGAIAGTWGWSLP